MLLNTGKKYVCPRIKICENLREWDDEIEIQKIFTNQYKTMTPDYL
jgi:hypothetical protein